MLFPKTTFSFHDFAGSLVVPESVWKEALPEFGKIGLRKSSRFGKIGFGHFSYQTNLQNVRYLAVICRYLPLFCFHFAVISS